MCEPTLMIAATMAVQGGAAIFSAGTQARAGQRSARLTLWQSMQASDAALKESAAIFDDAAYTSGALTEQYDMASAASLKQLDTNNRAYIEQYEDSNRAGTELLADTSRATLEQLGETSAARIDQAQRATATYDRALQIAKFNAQLAMDRGNVEENRSRADTERGLATTTAYFASNNMDPTYGSPLLLQTFGAAQGEADARIIRAAALQESAGFQWEALGYAERGNEAVATATTGLRSDYLSASRTLDSAQKTTARTLDAASRAVSRNVEAGIAATEIGIVFGGRTTERNIESTFRTAGSRAGGVVSAARTNATAATIAADNARQAGKLGAATTLINTASNWASLALGGKIPGVKV